MRVNEVDNGESSHVVNEGKLGSKQWNPKNNGTEQDGIRLGA